MAQDSLKLADQLATTRESAGRQEAGLIAAAAADKDQTFRAGQTTITEAGATARNAASNQTSLGVAGIGAASATNVATINANAGAELRAAQARDADARTNLTTAETSKVKVVTGLQQTLADEYANPTPAPAKIQSLSDQIGAQGLTAATRSAALTSLDSLAKSESVTSNSLSQQLATETDKLSGMMLDPEQRARQQSVVNGLQTQLNSSRARQNSLVDQARGMMPGQARPSGTINKGDPSATPTGTPDAAPSVTPSGVPSVMPGAPGDTPVTPPGMVPPAGPAKPGDSQTAPAKLPGDIGNATNVDVIKEARPDLNTDALKGMSPGVIGRVMQLVEGRATLPPSGTRSQDAQLLLTLATTVDPSLDEASSKARMAMRVSLASGPIGANRTNINTALGHLGELYNATSVLNNSWQPTANWVANSVATGLGSGRPNNVQLIVNGLAGEMTKVYNGSGGNLHEVKGWQDSFPVNGSLTQQREAMETAATMLNSKLTALADQINTGMKTTINPVSLLTPDAQSVFSAMTGKTEVPKGGFKFEGGATAYQLGSPPRPGRTPAAATPALSAAPATNPDLQRLWGQ